MAGTNYYIERLGGKPQYELVIFQMCEMIMKDSKLAKFHAKSSIDDLCELQTTILELALCDFESEDARKKLFARSMLMNYRNFENGLNSSHCEILKGHLMEAMLDNLIDAELMEEVLERFDKLKFSFYGAGAERVRVGAGDDDEFELPLNKVEDKNAKQDDFRRSSSGSSVERMKNVGNSIKKGIWRRLSGDNLSGRKKDDRRTKGTSTKPILGDELLTLRSALRAEREARTKNLAE